EKHFHWSGPSPHMLYFQKVRDQNLEAIIHVDDTTRIQTVREDQNPMIHALLTRFRDKTRAGILCNTSLNCHGSGFINRTSDLYSYDKTTGGGSFFTNGGLCIFRGAGQKNRFFFFLASAPPGPPPPTAKAPPPVREPCREGARSCVKPFALHSSS